MTFRSVVSRVWNDPVWSKVIAAGIVTGASFLAIRLSTGSPSSSPAWHSTLTFIVPGGVVALVVWFWLRSRPSRKTLVFLSQGGTCRDPMAKAITEKLLAGRKLRYPVDIRAVGLGPVTTSGVSYAARYVIREMYNEDLLQDHHAEQMSPKLVKRADLILAMDKSLIHDKNFPRDKTFVLKEFFGSQGDVADPYPDGKDAATLERYRKCAEELRTLLTANIDRVLQVLAL